MRLVRMSAGASLEAMPPAEAYKRAEMLISPKDGAEPRLLEARPLLELAAGQGHAEAAGRLGRWYLLGLGGAKQDPATASALLHAASALGDNEARFWLAQLLLAPSKYQPKQADGVRDPNPIAAIKDSEAAEEEFKRGREVIRQIRALQKENRRRAREAPEPGAAQQARPTEARPRAPWEPNAEDDETAARLADPVRPPLPERNLPLAWRVLERAADAGHTPSMVALGNQLMRASPPRVEAAFGWYVRALEAGNGDGAFNAGLTLFDGVAPHASLSDTQGDPAAAVPLAPSALLAPELRVERTAEGKLVLPPRPRDAVAYFDMASSLGDPSAMFWLGTAKLDGMEAAGVKEDPAAGLALLQAAAHKGHGGARLFLSRALREGRPEQGLPADEAEADRWLEAAAAAGEGEALYELATLALGHGDRVAAMGLFMNSGARGFAEGYTAAGVLAYQGGPWGGQDYRRALALYQQAADLGSEGAWRNIAAMYARGEGVPASEEHARYILHTVLGQAPPAGSAEDPGAPGEERR
ncbi:hypothetical protein FNF27_02135 [Cafeteria roenbergensis]|uniref:Sel1 repeat family protein n=1 Tax=Cafeteria roenbergensis TaxID=33653 RepID=A0A5A8EFW2_CAFRO|nr:hypothetical protein FNF27_02135 [Cafeteria roenbergensis]